MGSVRVAGLDLGFANWGIARMQLDLDTLDLSLERVRTISTEKLAGKKKLVRQNSDDFRRAKELYDGLQEELKGCSVAFAEIPSGAQHARSAWGLGISIGVLSSAPAVIEVMPVETKMASVGSKTADKPEVIAWAAAKYPHISWQTYEKEVSKKGKLLRRAGDLHDDNEHSADACAVVHAGIRTPEFKQLLALWRASSI
jgi:hypothetical protein